LWFFVSKVWLSGFVILLINGSCVVQLPFFFI